MKYERQLYTMLVVEDSNEDFAIIEWAFKKSGIALEITRCMDGDDALDFLRRQGKYVDLKSSSRPSLIWLDLNLPGTDGREVLEQIKADQNLKTIPIIVVTTSSNYQDIELCYEQGTNSYLVKPMDLNELVELVKRVNDFWFKTAILPEK